MPCCCLSSSDENDKKKNVKNTGSPPGTQSMKDRGGFGGGGSSNAVGGGSSNSRNNNNKNSNTNPEYEDDKNAVAWLRTRSLENKQHPQEEGEEEGLFEKQKERMQNRNPLEKPYDLSEREMPLRPQNGNVLVVRPSHGGGATEDGEILTPDNTKKNKNRSKNDNYSTPSTVASSLSPGSGDDDMEIFEPQGYSPGRKTNVLQVVDKAEFDHNDDGVHDSEYQEQRQQQRHSNMEQYNKQQRQHKRNDPKLTRVYTLPVATTPTPPPKATEEKGPKLNRKRSTDSNKSGSSSYSSSNFNATNFVEVGGLLIPQTTQGIPIVEKKKKNKQNIKNNDVGARGYDGNGDDDDSGHLSDVPSDVDSVTKERYLLACQILKTTLIEKEKSLIPIEREYILSLLGDYGKNRRGLATGGGDGEGGETSSMISEDHVSAIESAALRLEQDPLFQDPVHPSISAAAAVASAGASGTLTASSIALTQRRSEDEESTTMTNTRKSRRQKQQQKQTKRSVEQIPKHRHTATKSRKSPFDMCQPSSISDAGIKTEARKKEMNFDNSTFEVLLQDKDDDSSSDEKDDSSTVINKSVDPLVRFDGWSFHQQDDQYPFQILGADDNDVQPRVLTPSIMEALRGFFPFNVSESNFWLKFSLVRDGASLATLLSRVRASTYTIVGVETNHGEVFGSFTGSPWRVGTKWYGSGESFLWRLKRSRLTSQKNSHHSNFENKMEVYPFTGYDDLVQYCTTKTMAVGGGDWRNFPCPFDDEPKGIGFMVDGDLQGGETNSCATFANPRLSKRASTSNEFSLVNMEVWALTPCLNVKDAEKLELKRMFVEQNMEHK